MFSLADPNQSTSKSETRCILARKCNVWIALFLASCYKAKHCFLVKTFVLKNKNLLTPWIRISDLLFQCPPLHCCPTHWSHCLLPSHLCLRTAKSVCSHNHWLIIFNQTTTNSDKPVYESLFSCFSLHFVPLQLPQVWYHNACHYLSLIDS